MSQTFCQWTPQLETGIAAIDAQHRHLFTLAASFAQGQEVSHVMMALAELASYVRNHFRDEEALLASLDYPGLEAHRALHDQFRQLLTTLVAEARQLTMEQIAERVRHLVNDLFYQHIMVADLDYVSAVAGRT